MLFYFRIPALSGVQEKLFFRIGGGWDKGQEKGVRGIA